MEYLLLKFLHFSGLIFWLGSLMYVVSQIRLLEKGNISSVSYRETVSQSLQYYKKWTNPAMMFAWLAGIALIVFHGLEWFRTNLWIHQKILLLIFLTVYQVYCRIRLKRMSESADSVKSVSNAVFSGYFYLIILFILLLAVFRPASMGIMGLIVGAAAIGMIYISYQMFSKKSRQH